LGRAEGASPRATPAPARAAILGPSLLLAATGAAVLAWTWRAWPDPLIDFGRELYVPWRLAEGDSLFDEIAWFNGPLSPHWNALLFRLFGPGFSVLVWSNVLILAATVAMVYALLLGVAGRLAATVGGMVFLLVFACGQYVGVGNYNWIAPYSHELTHGVALAVAALAALDRWGRTGSMVAAGLGGSALGLCFLTKVEPFVAGAAGCAVLLAPALARRDLRAVGAFFVAALAPTAGSALLVGWRGTVGAWPSVLAGEVTRLPFYIGGAGLDDPGLRIAEALAWSAMWAVVLAPPLGAAWLARETRGPWIPLVAGASMLVAMLLVGDSFAWREAVRPLALVALVAGVVLSISIARGERSRRSLTALALTAFALALLAKMLLNVRTAHYGFALAMPATLVASTLLVGWLPAWLDRRRARGDVFLACALAVLAVFAGRHVEATGAWLTRKSEVVGEGRDAFRADARGALVRGAVARVRASGAAAVAVLPEGVMINYLARTPAPTPFVTFIPPEEILFGDEAWTAAFRDSPPELVIWVPRDASEYGAAPFGVGFGRSLAAWIEAEYADVDEISAPGVGLTLRVLAPRS